MTVPPLTCWRCAAEVRRTHLDFDAVLVPRTKNRGGPVLVLQCPECGEKNIAERNQAGDHLLIPPVLAGFRNPSVKEAEARRWARENTIRRAEFHIRPESATIGSPEEETPPEVPQEEPPEPPRAKELNSVLGAYEALGLELTATPDEIRKRYHELVRKCHPDRVADLDEAIRRTAERRFLEVSRAYELLAGD